jgi:hypothetical protein
MYSKLKVAQWYSLWIDRGGKVRPHKCLMISKQEKLFSDQKSAFIKLIISCFRYFVLS